MKEQRFEQGQALVLIVLSIVAIFGFAALAVDMGRIYAERRRAQSAADSAALAAAYEAANSTSDKHSEILALVKSTAFGSALENGYDVDKVEVYSPPTHGDFEECDCEYVQVVITSTVDPIFVQVLGRGSSTITTEAIARGRRSQSISTGNAVHALIEDNESGDGIEVDGSMTFRVKNGNIYSNKNGVKKGTPGTVKVSNGRIITHDGWTNTTGVSASGGIRKDDALHIPVPTPPDCAVTPRTFDSNNSTLLPGLYSDIKMSGNGSYTMKQGMYCLDGDFTINGGVDVKGDGVFIVMRKGSLTIDGNSSVKWKRPNDLLDAAGAQWGGMLIFVLPGNTNTVSLSGDNQTFYVGTVFAPKAKCEYGGNNLSTAVSAQLVCHQIRLHGTPDVTIDYHEEQDYRMSPIVELIN